MEFTEYAHGVPCWVDLATPDTAKARAFYGALFGWEIPEGAPEFGGYANARLRGKTVAGIAPIMQAGQPTAWNTYVKTDDARATLDAAAAAGGTIAFDAAQVADLGTMGFFIDTSGAFCGIWQPGTHIGAELANEPGAFAWNELSTRDTQSPMAFYPAVFGWTPKVHDMGAMTYTEWQVDGRSIAGMMPMPDVVPEQVPNHWGVYFAVEDCDAAVAKVIALGGQAMMEPMEAADVGRFCAVMDDQGASFLVIALNTPQ